MTTTTKKLGETLNFRTSAPQVIRDSWRRTDRTCRFVGQCVVCGTRTYAFDDGENDPRGALGRHAASSLSPEEFEFSEGLGEVPACFECMNDESQYRRAVEIAHARWASATRKLKGASA